MAKRFGCKDLTLKACISFLEKKYPMASDGNTPAFGGGTKHHINDFAHHPTLIGLIFSIITQITGKAFGTDTEGNFQFVDITDTSTKFIGETVSQKLFFGIVIWFMHLVSDMAGSSSSADTSKGTGIPGPILSLAKELSVLPFFKNITLDGNQFSVFLSKLFNGTLLAKHDEQGRIIPGTKMRFDFRTEFGFVIELSSQFIPVLANSIMVRSFYFFRRLGMEIHDKGITSMDELNLISWDLVKPFDNATITRMLTISKGVFSSVDFGAAMLKGFSSSNPFVFVLNINYAGVISLGLTISKEVAFMLQRRRLHDIKAFYARLEHFSHPCKQFSLLNEKEMSRFGLDTHQVEILYNLEYLLTKNDIENTKVPIKENDSKKLKEEWLSDYKNLITKGYSEFTNEKDAVLHWYSREELLETIQSLHPEETWFSMVLLEASLFTPYFPITTEQNKDGEEIPSKKYESLKLPFVRYDRKAGSLFLDSLFDNAYYQKGFVPQLLKSHKTIQNDLTQHTKSVVTKVALTAAVTLASGFAFTALAPTIAVALVGGEFATLHGAALTSACLAYLGGGALAIGGTGMAGGTVAIVGGGALLGATVTGSADSINIPTDEGKEAILSQMTKLLTALKEIILAKEGDTPFFEEIMDRFNTTSSDLEKGLIEKRLNHENQKGEEKKFLKKQIQKDEDTIHFLSLTRKTMLNILSEYKKKTQIPSSEETLS